MIKNISGVILAGGASNRFNGLIKTRIVIDGKPIISRIIETIGDIFEEIIIVTNTPEEFEKYNNCKIIGDKLLNKGPLGGIHSALKESDREALFVVGGDMPFLRKELIIRQIDFYYKNECDILIPKINQYIEPLHGIYRKTLIRILEEYLEEENDYAVREFFKKVDVRYLQLKESEISGNAFININTPSDLADVKNLLGLPD